LSPPLIVIIKILKKKNSMYGIGKMLGRTPEEYLKKRQASQKQKPPSHELADFEKMPPSQTLVNNRKIIQNHEGKYLPMDPKVRRARQIKNANINNAEWREAKDA
jgi:hypothetical protein